MVDSLVNLEAWLSEASLFAEPIDSINFDDVSNNEKTNFKETPVLRVPDLAWLDEKVDLSVPINLDSLLDHRNETQASMEDDTAFLFGLLGSDFPSAFDVFTNEEIDLAKQLDVENFISEPASSDILDTHLASPRCNSLQINSPSFFPVQSPASPYSDISDASDETSSSHIVQSPASFTTDFTSSSFDSPQVQVSVCDGVANSSSNSEPVLSIEEVSRSVRKRKFVSDGESIPKVKVILTDKSLSTAPRPRDRRERKKVQNKEAAARYRIKKRIEEKVLSDEVDELESHQRKLQAKHDDLQSEIKYLKKLMCEILVKKGVMK